MKAHPLLIAFIGIGLLASTSCRTTYIDRTVYVEQPSPTPRPKSKPQPVRPRVDNPDSFEAVGKPTSYSY
ncbi:MAG: hypothetical protein WCH98_14630 [Verrucomicrobiota bacterium]